MQGEGRRYQIWDWKGSLVAPLWERNFDATGLSTELLFAVENYMSICCIHTMELKEDCRESMQSYSCEPLIQRLTEIGSVDVGAEV